MIVKAPVSFCLITKEDPFLEQCVKSFVDYVQEVVIVITSNTDTASIEVAKKYNAKYECFTDCNDPETGFINDFAMARNRSFEIASQPWICWCDSDDLVTGCDKLNDIINAYDSTRQDIDAVSYLFPYEYSYNERGGVSCRHYRERLISNKNFFKFINPVHEVMIPLEGARVSLLPREELVFKHQRQYSTKPVEPGRNLRILKKHFESTGGTDARQMYYLGLECCNAGIIQEAIKHLSKYIEISGWDDERAMACYKLVDIYQALGQYNEGLRWAFKSIEVKENWFEGYFALTRMFYFLACAGGPNEFRNWEKCAYFGKIGLTHPPTQTLLFINTADRDEIHKYLNVALNKMGDVRGALESVKTGMKNQPDDPTLNHNKRLYEVFISKQQVVESLNLLRETKELETPEADLIVALLNKQITASDHKVNATVDQSSGVVVAPISDMTVPPINSKFPIVNQTTAENIWGIPRVFDFGSFPVRMTDEQLQATVIMIWKQYMLHDEVLPAISLLENAPYSVKHMSSIENLLGALKNHRDRKYSSETFSVSDDVATSDHIYECLVDPVKEMLVLAKEKLSSKGKFLLTTQHGARLRGEYVANAKPWVDVNEKHSWLADPRIQITAPTTWTVANNFRKAGFWVKNSFVKQYKSSQVLGQGDIFAEAYLQEPQNNDKLDVVMFAGDGIEIWNPEIVREKGIGGSELMFLELSKRLAGLGHRVRAYIGCGKEGEGIYDGVEYYSTEKYHSLKCDVLVVSRNCAALDDSHNIEAKLKLLWVHDVWAMNATNALLLKADKILALSEWHKQNLINVHNVHPDQVLVTRNGIDLSRFDKKVERNRFKCVNSSSPDRSWPILFEVWPRIKEQVPQAELHLYYGFKNWEYAANYSQPQRDLITYLKQKISDLAIYGVVYHDRVNQAQLAEEFLGTGVWTHPTWFTETSCISAMEMQAAGVRMVTSSIAALKETVANRGILLDGDWTSVEYKDKFVQMVVSALKHEDDSDRHLLQQYAREYFGLDGLAKNWEKMFHSLIEGKKADPITPYRPTRLYITNTGT